MEIVSAGAAVLTLAANEALKTLVSESIKNIISSKWRDETECAKNVLEYFDLEHVIKPFVSKIESQVLTFRSLSNGGKNVRLTDVYHPLKLKVEDSNDIFPVDDTYQSFNYDGVIVISGSAGQGKTTVLRKMYLEELKSKRRFPLFITLRLFSFSEKLTLVDVIHEHLKSFGIECTQQDVIYLLQSSKLVLFFDGFDEVPNTNRTKALDLIRMSWNRYSCPVIVTTRPHTEVYRESGFKNLSVQPLSLDDVIGIINKCVHEDDKKKGILDFLENKKFMQDAIVYPILVEILIVTYYSFKNSPESIAEFYANLFDALIFSHDHHKGFDRYRHTKLSVKELRKCFNCFSLVSLLENKQDFNDEKLVYFFEYACEVEEIDENPEKIKDDIVDGTNLICRDGHRMYSYVHRSIQEYHAACALFSQDDKNTLYKVLSHEFDVGKANFFRFLKVLDKKDFYKNFLSNAFLHSGISGADDPLTTNEILELVLNSGGITIRIVNEGDSFEVLLARVTLDKGIKYMNRLYKLNFLASILQDGHYAIKSIGVDSVINLDAVKILFKEKSLIAKSKLLKVNPIGNGKKETSDYYINISEFSEYSDSVFNIEKICKNYTNAFEIINSFYHDDYLKTINQKRKNRSILRLIKK